MELNYKVVSGIILLIIAASSGTFYIEKTGDYDNCRAEWNLNNNGTYTCPKTNITNYCYEIENRGSGWYRCWIGKIIIVKDNEMPDPASNPVQYLCSQTECISIPRQ